MKDAAGMRTSKSGSKFYKVSSRQRRIAVGGTLLGIPTVACRAAHTDSTNQGKSRQQSAGGTWDCVWLDFGVSQVNEPPQTLGLREQHFHQEPSVCALLEICYYIPTTVLISSMLPCDFYCKERFKEAEIWPVYWNEKGAYTLKYYRKLNFSKISTRVRLIFVVNSLCNEISSVFPRERNFTGTYMGLQSIFTLETLMLHLGNSCILPFISLQSPAATAVTHTQSTELIPPLALNVCPVLYTLAQLCPLTLDISPAPWVLLFRAKNCTYSGSWARLHFSTSPSVKWAWSFSCVQDTWYWCISCLSL